ncbi:MAG: hypothetical protein WB791_05345 [Waddliaceae bacterium]
MSTFDKLTKIEALIARASSEGEYQAVLLAKERIQKRTNQESVEYRISTGSPWKKKAIHRSMQKVWIFYLSL